MWAAGRGGPASQEVRVEGVRSHTEAEMRPQDRRILLALIWLLGAVVRLFPLLQFPGAMVRPFGMGGLYLLFSQEILRHGWALPTHIPYYTLKGLPYAYPPLAFYVEAAVLRWLSPPTFLLTSLLPALFSILTIGAFCLLAREFFAEPKALLATAIYALLPAAFLEHLPGEGLVEGLGTLLFILGVTWFLRLSRRPAWGRILLLGVWAGLSVLASPGGTYGLALSVLVLWLLRAGRPAVEVAGVPQAGRRLPLWHLLVAAGVGLLLSAPYWVTVMVRHTPAIFLRTFSRQHADLGVWILVKMGFLVEQKLPLSPWGILALIGLAGALGRRCYVLPVWCVLLYMIPREFAYLVAVPLALLACDGLQEVILPGARRWLEEQKEGQSRSIAVGLLLFVLFGWGVIRAFAWGLSLPVEKDMVTSEELAAMAWIQEYTPAETTFLVIGDEIEWFPILTKRTTLNVIWGSEWVEDDTVFELAGDLDACSSPGCYLSAAGRYGLRPDYLYISHGKDYLAAVELAAYSQDFEFVWENEGASLFHVR